MSCTPPAKNPMWENSSDSLLDALVGLRFHHY